MAKTRTENSTKLSKYVCADDKPVTMGSDMITGGSNPVDFYIADLNRINATMHEYVTAPYGGSGNKPFFDGTSWTNNSDWVAPNAE